MDILKDRDLRLPLVLGAMFLIVGLYIASKIMSLITGSTWSGFLLFISVSLNVLLISGIMTPAQLKSMVKQLFSSPTDEENPSSNRSWFDISRLKSMFANNKPKENPEA